jgi:hypothetical protein
LAPTLSYTNPVHIISTAFFKICFYTVFPSKPWSSKYVSFPQVCRPTMVHRNYNVK